jgi:hypothetical protein
MSRKNVLVPYRLIAAGNMAGDITSGVTDVQYLDNIGLQLIFTGTPTGDFFVDVSLDGGTTWTPLSLSPAPQATGGPGSLYVDINQISAPKIRVRYDFSAGTGVLNAYLCGKAV